MIFWMKSGKDKFWKWTRALVLCGTWGWHCRLKPSLYTSHGVCYHLHSPTKKHLCPDGNCLFQGNTNVNHHWEGWRMLKLSFGIVSRTASPTKIFLLSQASSKYKMVSATFPFIQQQLESTRRQRGWWFVVSQSILHLWLGYLAHPQRD